jgi:hypothetical protein
MNLRTKERINQRAFAMWEAGGRVDGRDLEHWLRAEQEVLAEETSVSSPKKAVPAKKKARQARKTGAPAKSRSGATGSRKNKAR